MQQTPFVVNPFVRFHGAGLLPFYPCSLDCVHACTLAKRYYEALANVHPSVIKHIHEDCCGRYVIHQISDSVTITKEVGSTQINIATGKVHMSGNYVYSAYIDFCTAKDILQI